MDKKLERSYHGKILRRVASLLVPLGFQRARSTFFVRRKTWVIEFVHLHKYSFTSGYRIHLGVRVLNDVFPAPSLNGPDSHAYTCPDSPNGSRYNLDFGPNQTSIESCAAEIHRWCSEVGVPWFEHFHDPQVLLADIASPLPEDEKAQLRLALKGKSDPDAVKASLSMFGLEE